MYGAACFPLPIFTNGPPGYRLIIAVYKSLSKLDGWTFCHRSLIYHIGISILRLDKRSLAVDRPFIRDSHPLAPRGLSQKIRKPPELKNSDSIAEAPHFSCPTEQIEAGHPKDTLERRFPANLASLVRKCVCVARPVRGSRLRLPGRWSRHIQAMVRASDHVLTNPGAFGRRRISQRPRAV